ncbi:MAG: molecular chaperone [Hyphomonas sp.]
MRPLALLLIGAVWFLLPANAQGLAIAPIMVEAPAGGGATSLTLSSDLDHDVTVQVRVFDWTQKEGEEQLEPARGLRFAPEIFTLRPGTSQVIRMSVPDTGGAGAWRIIIDELPSPEGLQEIRAAQLSIRLRYVLAMFAGDPAKPESLEARLGEEALHLRNPGPGWLRLHDLSLQTDLGEAVPAGPGILYLLPGSEMGLPPPEQVRVSALNYSVNGRPFATMIRHVR